MADGRVTTITGSAPSFSGDGACFAYVSREGLEHRVLIANTADPASAAIVRKGPERVDAPALSADGSKLFIAGNDANVVTVMNTATNTVSNVLTSGFATPWAVAAIA